MSAHSRIAALLLTLAPSVLVADGFIYIPEPGVTVRPVHPPRRWPRPRPRPHFPMQVTKHRVEVEIEDTVVKTRVAETFHNPNHVQLEGQYIFPLPPGASISGFTMKMGGKVVSGEVLEKDKARGIYEQIVRQVRDPGLLEYVDRGLFKARVFPIPPRGGVDVTIEYTETLERDAGVCEYRYPLDTGKYASGPYQNVVLDVKLRGSQPLRSIHSPSHKVDVHRKGDREARISFEAKTLQADKDFTLVWNVSEDALAPVLLTHRNHEKQGFFYLSITPRPGKDDVAPPKDVAFVIDTSGSMLGKKMEHVKKALRYCVNGLNKGDRFNIVDFSTEARRFQGGLVEVDDKTRAAALEYIDGLTARGGTNLEEGLRFALQGLDDANRLQMVALLTDGEPTIGVVRPANLLKSVRDNNKVNRRIFAFAVGEDLNAKLLDQLVKAERGASQYIRDDEDIELRLSSFYDKIDSPVLTDIRVEFPGEKPGAGMSDIYPRPFPDLFKGDQLAVLGRFHGGGHKSVILRGKFLGKEKVFEYSLDFGDGKPSSERGHVARLWAARKVGYMIEQMRLSGETKEVKDEVVRLAKLYGIITPFTSYLIIEEDGIALRPGSTPVPGLRDTARRRAANRARGAFRYEEAASEALSDLALEPTGDAEGSVETRGRPSSVSGGAAGAKLKNARSAFGKSSGKDAVEFSRKLGELKKAEVADFDEAEEFLREGVNRSGARVKKVASRTFYFAGDRWIDAALGAMKKKPEEKPTVERLKYLSDEYFALLAKNPGIGKLLSVGERVTFLWKGKVIAIDS